MQVEVTELGGGIVLKPGDELDLLGYQDLARELGRILGEGAKTIILDLELVTYVNSSAVRMLLAMNERVAGAGGSLVLARTSAGVDAMFEAGGIGRAMKAYDSIQDAMVALSLA